MKTSVCMFLYVSVSSFLLPFHTLPSLPSSLSVFLFLPFLHILFTLCSWMSLQSVSQCCGFICTGSMFWFYFRPGPFPLQLLRQIRICIPVPFFSRAGCLRDRTNRSVKWDNFVTVWYKIQLHMSSLLTDIPLWPLYSFNADTNQFLRLANLYRTLAAEMGTKIS
jgi:hypothetical protein